MDSTVDLKLLAKQTEGLSGDAFVRLVKEVRRHVVYEDREFITIDDFNLALEIILDKREAQQNAEP